jgi:hypothetical protein
MIINHSSEPVLSPPPCTNHNTGKAQRLRTGLQEQKKLVDQAQWLMFVILATWEVETGGLELKASPGQKS